MVSSASNRYEENELLARRFLEDILGKKKYEIAYEIFSDDFKLQTETEIPKSGHLGPKGVIERIKLIHIGFPDLSVEIKEIVSDGSTVFVFYHMVGIHKGEFMGAAPTDEKIEIQVFHLFKFNSEGKVISTWFQYNSLEVFIQLQLAQINDNNPKEIMRYLKYVVDALTKRD